MAYSDQGFRKADQDNKADLEAKGGLSGTPNAVNKAWAEAVCKSKGYSPDSVIALRKLVRDKNLTISASLVPTHTVELYADDEGDYFVDGGPRNKILCSGSFICALNTFKCELARTAPA